MTVSTVMQSPTFEELFASCRLRTEIGAPTYHTSKAPLNEKQPDAHEGRTVRDGIVSDISACIGETPLLRADRLRDALGLKCQLLLKLEYLNAGGSIKDRIARRMIEMAEKEGKLKKGDYVVEATSGNTGVGLALMCASRGYQMVVVMPEKMRGEKLKTLQRLGSKVIFTPTTADWDSEDSHITTAYRLVAEINSRSLETGVSAICLDQYLNGGNVQAHYDETGAEILRQTKNRVDAVVIASGTGGTISGVSRRLHAELGDKVKVVGVDPHGSILHKSEWKPSDIHSYEVEGIGYDFHPSVFYPDAVDHWEITKDGESLRMARQIVATEGVLCGGSSGSAMVGAVKSIHALSLDSPDKVVVVLLADNIRNYMSKFADDHWMASHAHFLSLESHNDWQHERTLAKDAASVSVPVIPASATVAEAVEVCQSKNVSRLVVTSANRLVGVVSLADLQLKQLELKSHTPVQEAAAPASLFCVPSSWIQKGSVHGEELRVMMLAMEQEGRMKDPCILICDNALACAADLQTRRSTTFAMEVTQNSFLCIDRAALIAAL